MMSLKLSTLVIILLFGVSSIFTQDSDIHRYKSYDLEEGPVFYEAYYPDTKEYEGSRDRTAINYHEQSFLDRRPAVLEKTYQISPKRLAYAKDSVWANSNDNYRAYDSDDNFRFIETEADKLERHPDLREITKLARRAIFRDLKNWNTLENYLNQINTVREPNFLDLSKQHESMIRESQINKNIPMENIFAPRPQLINYIFSKKSRTTNETRTETKEESKTEENKNKAKIMSIEISEVPRHKIRHHHGELPKRNYYPRR